MATSQRVRTQVKIFRQKLDQHSAAGQRSSRYITLRTDDLAMVMKEFEKQIHAEIIEEKKRAATERK